MPTIAATLARGVEAHVAVGGYDGVLDRRQPALAGGRDGQPAQRIHRDAARDIAAAVAAHAVGDRPQARLGPQDETVLVALCA